MVGTGIAYGNPKAVTEWSYFDEDRVISTNVGVKHAVGHELAHDQGRVGRSFLRDVAIELGEHMPARIDGSLFTGPDRDGDRWREYERISWFGRHGVIKRWGTGRACRWLVVASGGAAARPGRGAARSSDAPLAPSASPSRSRCVHGRVAPEAERAPRPCGGPSRRPRISSPSVRVE